MEEVFVYVDTSAYLAMLLEGKRGEPTRQFMEGKSACSSILLVLEAERNIVRLSREKKIDADLYEKSLMQLKADRELFYLREFTSDLCLNNSFPPVHTPRSMDLAHLRTALWFQNHRGLHSFVTLDEAQKKAAFDFGLPIF